MICGQIFDQTLLFDCNLKISVNQFIMKFDLLIKIHGFALLNHKTLINKGCIFDDALNRLFNIHFMSLDKKLIIDVIKLDSIEITKIIKKRISISKKYDIFSRFSNMFKKNV